MQHTRLICAFLTIRAFSKILRLLFATTQQLLRDPLWGRDPPVGNHWARIIFRVSARQRLYPDESYLYVRPFLRIDISSIGLYIRFLVPKSNAKIFLGPCVFSFNWSSQTLSNNFEATFFRMELRVYFSEIR